jgi:hypothetical protein
VRAKARSDPTQPACAASRGARIAGTVKRGGRRQRWGRRRLG